MFPAVRRRRLATVTRRDAVADAAGITFGGATDDERLESYGFYLLYKHGRPAGLPDMDRAERLAHEKVWWEVYAQAKLKYPFMR